MENIIVMRHLFPLFMITITLLCGCNDQYQEVPPEREPHYSEVENLHIEWKDLFSQEDEFYCAYVYSVSCVPCSMLREQVINFAKENHIKFYFIFPSGDIPFVEDPVQADNSLGASKIEDVYCYNTPTLIEITNHTISKYLRDYYEIKGYMESYQ